MFSEDVKVNQFTQIHFIEEKKFGNNPLKFYKGPHLH